jgi:hypothetical protein
MLRVEGREARPVVGKETCDIYFVTRSATLQLTIRYSVTSSRRTATLQNPPRLTGNIIIPIIASNNGIQLRQ